MENKELLRKGLEAMGIALTKRQEEQFEAYKKLLIDWNTRMNLTAIIESEDIDCKHFLDCAVLIGWLKRAGEAKRMIDVGTGAGFPGLPVKILFPECHMTLLDSLAKRVSFLEEVARELSLSDVDCIHGRAEDFGKNPLYRETYDICVSRAVANCTVLSEYCLPFVKKGGYLLALKGPAAELEVKEAKNAITVLGGSVEEIKKVEVPFGDLTRYVVVIQKIQETPQKYPRKSGKALKNPIL